MPNSNNIFTKFKKMPVDGIIKTVIVATALCFVCSMVVSFAAVNLKSIQEVNKAIDKQKNILQVAGVYHEGIDVNKTFSSFQPLVVDLNSGKFTDKFDPSIFDDKKASQDPLLSIALKQDPASIGRRANFVTIYLLKNNDGSLDKVILPVHGYGLWSTLYGFIALENNLNDIFGLQFYQHAETPGLGAEVDNPKWKALWPGKQLYKDDDVVLEVIKGKVPADDSNLAYKVDGLSGATITSRGVSNMIKYWFSDSGYANLFSELDYES